MMREKDYWPLAMKCPLCGHHNPPKHGKTSQGSQQYYCLNCHQTFSETGALLDSRPQVKPTEMQTREVIAAPPWSCVEKNRKTVSHES